MRKIFLIILLNTLFIGICFADFQAVTKSAHSSGTGTAVNNTVTATTQGNLLVVHIRVNGTSETCSSVTDDKGNTYGLIGPQDVGGGGAQRQYMAYAVQVVGGVTTVTGNFSGSVIIKEIGVDEYSGCKSTNATCFDTSLSDQGGGTSLGIGFGGLTPAASGELIVSAGTINNSLVWTAGSGFTLFNGSATDSFRSQYKLSGTTNESCPMSVASDSFGWTEIGAAFIPAPVVATPSNVKIYNTKLYNTKIYG